MCPRMVFFFQCTQTLGLTQLLGSQAFLGLSNCLLQSLVHNASLGLFFVVHIICKIISKFTMIVK